MRIAVISDTHLPRGTRRLPARLLEECAAADAILHAGDLCTRDVLSVLEAYAPVHAVRGNNDEADLARLLAVELVVELAGVRIGMVHDAGPVAGRPARLLGRFPACAAVVFGHSHLPLLERERGMLILNPGSPTERRRAPTFTMASIVVDDHRLLAELIEV